MICAICLFVSHGHIDDPQYDAVTVIDGLAVCEDHAGVLAGADPHIRAALREKS